MPAAHGVWQAGCSAGLGRGSDVPGEMSGSIKPGVGMVDTLPSAHSDKFSFFFCTHSQEELLFVSKDSEQSAWLLFKPEGGWFWKIGYYLSQIVDGLGKLSLRPVFLVVGTHNSSRITAVLHRCL